MSRDTTIDLEVRYNEDDPIDVELALALAEMNMAYAMYEQTRKQVQAKALHSLDWFPTRLSIGALTNVAAMPYLRRQYRQFAGKKDETGFVNHVTAEVVARNRAVIEAALGGQKIEPRYIAYLILQRMVIEHVKR